MTSSAACECGAEEQTVDHVVLQCPIHRPRHGVHSLAVLNDMTIEWLLKTPFPNLVRPSSGLKELAQTMEQKRLLCKFREGKWNHTVPLQPWKKHFRCRDLTVDVESKKKFILRATLKLMIFNEILKFWFCPNFHLNFIASSAVEFWLEKLIFTFFLLYRSCKIILGMHQPLTSYLTESLTERIFMGRFITCQLIVR